MAYKHSYGWRGLVWGLVGLLFSLLMLSACQSAASPDSATATPVPTRSASSATIPASETPVPTPQRAGVSNSTVPGTIPSIDVQEIAPLASEEAAVPVSLRIPAIELDAPVTEMGWHVADVDGVRTTRWDVPADSAGWHPNSAKAGAAGNMVISGHQLLGKAVFAPLAMGDVTVGLDVLVTDADGRIFVYRVTDVTDPLPISTDLAEEEALAAQYAAQPDTDDAARLTLITGWPDFSTTHRIIVVAELIGVTQQQ